MSEDLDAGMPDDAEGTIPWREALSLFGSMFDTTGSHSVLANSLRAAARYVAHIEQERDSERAKVKALREALAGLHGLFNMVTCGRNLEPHEASAMNRAWAALAATSDPIEAPSDVHSQESGQ